MKNIWFVLPAYNEEEVLNKTAQVLSDIFEKLIENNKISTDSKILFADDGSKDKTWDIIEDLHAKNSAIKGIKLLKNSGQQFALFAAYEEAFRNNCDAVISLDVDMQDDTSVLENIVDRYEKENYEIILVTHNSRKTDTFFKSFTANAFYSVMNFLGLNVVKNHSEYRLMDRVVLERLMNYQESNLFLRGLIPNLSNNICIIESERKIRAKGCPKYNFLSSMNLALDGITSLTIKPLRLIFPAGIIVMFCSIFADTPELFAILFLGGLQILFIGLIGEYIAKISIQSKKRPKYFIEKSV